MFIAALFTIAKPWKQADRPRTEAQTKEMWCSHTMAYFSAFEKNLLPNATTGMNMEDIMLTEIGPVLHDPLR